MRDIKASLDAARGQKLRTTNSLSKTKEEIEHLESVKHPQLKQILIREEKQFASRDASVRRSRQRVLKARERLACVINRNQALMKLRHQLQQARWKDPDPPLAKAKLAPRNERFHEVELNY
jgi:hypothetical protein